jgi:hypothetical protein
VSSAAPAPEAIKPVATMTRMVRCCSSTPWVSVATTAIATIIGRNATPVMIGE